MQHSAIHHDSAIIEISHEASRLEVENLECAILTGSKEPLVILLEPKSSDVSSVSLIRNFVLVREYVVNFDYIMSGNPEIFSIRSYCQSVNLRVRVVDGSSAEP